MAKQFSQLTETIKQFINNQHLFFVATAGTSGKVNLSPKGMDSFRILDDHNIAWLNLTGSGNETAAHILELNRMTIMFCSFDKQPLILRLYGQANVIHPRDPQWNELFQLYPNFSGARQIFCLNIDLVQTSCGFGVPFYQFLEERETLTKFADNKGQKGIEEYWQQKNQLSLDGKPTGL